MSEAVNIYNIPNWLVLEKKPFIFELIVQENFSNDLKNGFKYLVQVLTNQYPEKFLKLNKYFDEIYLVFDSIVQALHLYHYQASFSESFFNLKRSLNNSNKECLSSSKLFASFVFLVLLPYFKDKFNLIYKKLELKHFETKVKLSQLEIGFIQTFPFLQSSWEIISLLFKLSYAVGQGSTSSPILYLLDLTLIRSNLNNNSKQAKSLKKFSTFTHWSLKAFKYNLTLAAYLIQFLNYWYLNEDRRITISSLVIPPTPKKHNGTQSSQICPICCQKRKNDAILKTSGFIFCQKCIQVFVKINGRCPVTGYYSNLNHIIPIYPPEF